MLMRSASWPEMNMQTAEMIWNSATALPNSARPHPNSSTIGFSVSPIAKRAPPLTNRLKKPAARTSAEFALKEDFMTAGPERSAIRHSQERCSHEALLLGAATLKRNRAPGLPGAPLHASVLGCYR